MVYVSLLKCKYVAQEFFFAILFMLSCSSSFRCLECWKPGWNKREKKKTRAIVVLCVSSIINQSAPFSVPATLHFSLSFVSILITPASRVVVQSFFVFFALSLIFFYCVEICRKLESERELSI